jgi:hypothetical protein
MGDRARMALAAGMLAIACRPTTSIGSTAGDTTSTTDVVTTSSDETTGTATSTFDATTQVGMDGSASESSVSTNVDDSGHDSRGHDSDGPVSAGPGGPDTDGDAMCMPAQFDSQCIACSKVHCCPEFAACADDFECGCTLGCLQYPGFPGPCMCAPTQQGAELFGCLATECDFVCPP